MGYILKRNSFFLLYAYVFIFLVNFCSASNWFSHILFFYIRCVCLCVCKEKKNDLKKFSSIGQSDGLAQTDFCYLLHLNHYRHVHAHSLCLSEWSQTITVRDIHWSFTMFTRLSRSCDISTGHVLESKQGEITQQSSLAECDEWWLTMAIRPIHATLACWIRPVMASEIKRFVCVKISLQWECDRK